MNIIDVSFAARAIDSTLENHSFVKKGVYGIVNASVTAEPPLKTGIIFQCTSSGRRLLTSRKIEHAMSALLRKMPLALSSAPCTDACILLAVHFYATTVV